MSVCAIIIGTALEVSTCKKCSTFTHNEAYSEDSVVSSHTCFERLTNVANVSIVIRLHASQTVADAAVARIEIKHSVPLKFI